VSHHSLHEGGAAPVGASSKQARDTTAFAYDENGQPASVQASQPRALETEEVASVVGDFAHAAANAIEAGFDGVEIHGANGYLIEQFINGAINDRSDRYTGATVEGRLAMVLEVVDAVAAKIGGAHTGIRLSPFNRIFDMQVFEGEEETWLALAQALSSRGLAYVHISNRDAILAMDGGKHFLHGFRQAYKGTLILAGQYTGEQAQADLKEDLGDLIAFGRPFISNPDLVERLKNGWPLTSPNPATFYGGGAEGYTDYPVYETAEA
jgi:N-ethylmaleimide reductase